MEHLDIIARAVIQRDNALLLCKHKSRTNYFLPGGHVEFGETAAAALIRELDEELGAKITDLRFLLVNENHFTQDGEIKHEINLFFTATIDERRDASREDHLEFAWIPIASLTNIELLPIVTQNALVRFFANGGALAANDVFISS